MKNQICLTKDKLDLFEKDIIDTTKSMIESSKFRMIHGTKVSAKLNKKTLEGLKKYRQDNWDSSVSKDKAYNKYLNKY